METQAGGEGGARAGGALVEGRADQPEAPERGEPRASGQGDPQVGPVAAQRSGGGGGVVARQQRGRRKRGVGGEEDREDGGKREETNGPHGSCEAGRVKCRQDKTIENKIKKERKEAKGEEEKKRQQKIYARKYTGDLTTECLLTGLGGEKKDNIYKRVRYRVNAPTLSIEAVEALSKVDHISEQD